MITTLRELRRRTGGDVVGGQVLCPGPGHGPRDRSLSIKLSATSPLGFICYSHAGDSFADCQAHVCRLLGIDPDAWKRHDDAPRRPTAARPEPPVVARGDDGVQERTTAAVDLWLASEHPKGTVVERYLASRGLELDVGVGKVIRWHPGISAMVALFRSIATGRPTAVSRTFLDPDGSKLKRMFAGPVGGAAVMLDGFAEITHGLHVCEGVETGLAARALGLRPTWAAGSAGAMAAFPVLSGIECLTLLQENDAASERAVERCAARWHDAGREVLINRPIGGKDLNDSIRGAA